MLSKMNGHEPIGYDEYLSRVLGDVSPEDAPRRDPEQIEKDMSDIVALYEQQRKEA